MIINDINHQINNNNYNNNNNSNQVIINNIQNIINTINHLMKKSHLFLIIIYCIILAVHYPMKFTIPLE